MADVRSLLQNERATRRIDHPQASYSATGKLECSVCKIPFKSDIGVWNKHIQSTQHAMRAERLRVSAKQPSARPTQSTTSGAKPEPSTGNKKRKAHDEEDVEDSRKRTRPEELNTKQPTKRKVSYDEPETPDIATTPTSKRVEVFRPSPSQVTAPPPPPASTESVDESEWAAFEASLARPPSPSPPPNNTAPIAALTAAATITAAPLTAAQLAAQSREELSLQRKEQREAEVEAEKEDAARHLEEEFDEMEELEERVRRLRERRESLRLKRAERIEQADLDDAAGGEPMEEAAGGATVEEEDDSGDDEDFDQWGTWGDT